MRKQRLGPKAVIFDMDGVIVDSMPYHFIAWYEALRPWDARISCFDVYLEEGEKWQYTLRDILKRSGIRPTPRMLQKIFTDRERIFKKYFKRYIFTGAEDLLVYLKRREYQLALVTSTPTVEMQRILPARIRNYFDHIVAGDNVRRGKPFPDPYLKAAHMLGRKPAECLVIENAPLGIRSAKRAGMKCIAITTSLPALYLQEADIVVNDLRKIAGRIGYGWKKLSKNNAKAKV
jgi:beta-phosphoglucomutase